ncbi:MAG: PAS domain-containing protein, partial [Myxococcales bacterium]|nr:PAS domain-containing protein [Myxococcales bacterium]
MRLQPFLDSLTSEQLIDRLNLALDGASLGIWDWDLRDNSVQFDRRWCEMLGLDVAEITMALSTWEERVHPDDIQQCYADIQAYLDGKTEFYENIHRMRHANGEWIYILDRGRISGWDAQGKAIRFTGTHFDCTTTERAKRVLQNQRELLAGMVSNLPVAVAMFDLEDRYLAASDQWLQDHQLDGGRILGHRHDELSAPLPSEWAQAWQRAQAGETVGAEQQRITGSDGRRRYLRWSMRPWRTGDDELAGIIVTSEDTTAAVEARLTQERDSRLSALGLMAGGVAHEINTPLQSLLLNAAMISEELDGHADLELLRSCNSAVLATSKRIANIIDALRTVSRWQPGDPLSPIDLGQLQEQIADLCRARFRHAGITLQVEHESGGPFLGLGRPADVGQILLNLLNNAFDAVADSKHENPEDAWVRLLLSADGEDLVFRVFDSGPGVAPEIQDMLMTPFCTTKPLGRGTGLGLSLSKSLAENLGGKLRHLS